MRTADSKTVAVALMGSLVVALMLALAGPVPTANAARAKLTNGCAVGPRGVPSCGAYFGAAYGANTNPSGWERSMGKTLGVHRTYWGASQVASAVATARADNARNRVPWMSFKAPYSWSQMAAGKGDAWARGLATKMRSAGGPVWVAIHHEPEGDGDIQVWKRMQARLAPIMRKAAPNLAYSIILMGYHEFYGAAKYRMNRIWPNTKIDIAGFDLYEKYGVKGITKWKSFNKDYFNPIRAWAKRTGVKWGLAETGYSDPAARRNPRWISAIYNAMRARGGIAFTYFNTNLNSVANWKLSLATKQSAFTRVNRVAPKMR